MKNANPKLDGYFAKLKIWSQESLKLRVIALGCGLDEDLKWGKPCYSINGGNVVIIQGFKAYCALLFFKGVLMKDLDGILIRTGENTHVGRQIRFENVQQIVKITPKLKAYIKQAIEIETSGAKVEKVEKEPMKVPEEFQKKLMQNASLKKAFEALTPGRQRAYIFFLSAAKQSKTRESRIEKCTPRILQGKGLNED